MIALSEITERINKLQNAMEEAGLAGAVIVQRADLFYYSGTGQNAHLFIPVEGEPTLLVKKTFSRAKAESPLAKILAFQSLEELKKVIEDELPAGSKIGLENDILPQKLYSRYQKLFAQYKLADLSGLIRRQRAVKSVFEIDLQQKAAVVSEAVFNYACQVIKEGLPEVELASLLEAKARRLGHQGAVRMRGFNQELYFGHILSGANAAAVGFFDGPASGPGLNSSFPQGAGYKIIRAGEPILVDFVTVLGGYMVDQTRIFALGKIKPRLLEAYELALAIKQAVITAGKPGVSGKDLFALAENMARKEGLDTHFMGHDEKVNFIGHGVGLELDELPVIARGFDIVLEENMVFALEPKFVFPGEGIVGIEDTFKVGPDGLEQITCFSNELQVI